MTVMYLHFGEDVSICVQAYFSMLSFYKQFDATDRMVVVTTSPHLFKRMEFAEIIPITNEVIEEWQGKHHFFWRAKIKAIEMVSSQYADDDLLYLDFDTFLYGDIHNIKQLLANGQGLMDVNDGHPSKRKFKPQRMWKTVANRTYANITLGMQHDMWIAGVVGIPKAKMSQVVTTALEICDGMLDDQAEPIVIEQYSLSIAMYEIAGLSPTQQWIAHYWKNKSQWIELIEGIMLRSFLSNAPVAEDIKAFDQISLKDIPIYIDKSNTNRRLKKLIDKILVNKDFRYINADTIYKKD